MSRTAELPPHRFGHMVVSVGTPLQAWWLEERLERHLGIVDRPIAGEHARDRKLLPPPDDLPTMGPAARATRQRLLDAATQAFVTRGFHETRVDDIVAAAGVSHGTFYRYFDNKDHVFRVIASRSGCRWRCAAVCNCSRVSARMMAG